jgi:hypothetical protein
MGMCKPLPAETQTCDFLGRLPGRLRWCGFEHSVAGCVGGPEECVWPSYGGFEEPVLARNVVVQEGDYGVGETEGTALGIFDGLFSR